MEGMGISKRTQVKVCDVCGHHGISNALVYCSKCSNTAVHQYCIGISPGSIDDTFDWFCEYCSSSMEFEHLSSYGARTEECYEDFTIAFERESKQYMNAIVCVEEEIKPLCILPPSSHSSSEQNYIDSLSLDYLLNDREESEEHVSSFMECPEEIMSGVVLLASLSGKIIIQSMSFFSSSLASNLDKPVEKYREVAYNCVACQTLILDDSGPKMDKEISTGHSDEDGTVYACQNITNEDGDVRKAIVIGLPTIGTRSFPGTKRKRSTHAKLDLIPILGLNCKRARSKRCKKSTFVGKEVDARKPTLHDAPATEITPINNLEFSLDAHKLPLLNESPSKDGGQQSERCISSPNQGLGRSEVLTFSSCATSSRRLAQTNFDGLYIREGKNGIMMPLYCRVCDAKVCEQVMDIEEGEVLHCNTSVFENFDVKEGEVTCKNAPHSKGYDIVVREVLPSNAQFPEGFDTNEREELCEHSKDYDLEEGEILDSNNERSEEYKIEEVEILDNNTSSHSKGFSYSLSNSTSQRQPLKCSIVCTSPMLKSGAPTTQSPYGKLAVCHVPTEKLQVEIADFCNKGESLKESITDLDAWEKYDDEIQKLKSNLEGEKYKLEEVVKKNRRQMWKVVYELESTKKELQVKIIELSKKTDEAEMAKKLATKERRKKEAYKDRLKACRKRH